MMSKQHATHTISATNKANIDAMKSLATTSIKATERLVALNLNFARGSINLGADYAQQISDDGLQSLMPRQDFSLQQSAETTSDYLRNTYDILAETQAEVAELTSARIHEISESMTAFIDSMAKSGPTGSEMTMAAVKTAIANANAVYNHVIKTAQNAGGSKPQTVVAKIAA